MLVSIVTPSKMGGDFPEDVVSALALAACIISMPPAACMLIMCAPCFVMVPTSRATVFGMS